MEIIQDKLVTSPICGSDAMYESEFKTQDGVINTWLCMTSGYTSNTTMTLDSEALKKTLELTADLIKDLRQDHVPPGGGDKLAWFPTVITTNWSGHLDFIHPDYNILIGGELKNVHESAANQFLLKESQWFNIDTNIANRAIKDVFKNYKKYWEKSRKQTQYLKNNFSFDKMTEKLNSLLPKIEPAPQMQPLTLPKLKKTELPKLKLPKLKKINA